MIAKHSACINRWRTCTNCKQKRTNENQCKLNAIEGKLWFIISWINVFQLLQLMRSWKTFVIMLLRKILVVYQQIEIHANIYGEQVW